MFQLILLTAELAQRDGDDIRDAIDNSNIGSKLKQHIILKITKQ